jgi:hypothetical protein
VTDDAATDPWFAGTGLAPGNKILDVVGNDWDSLPDPPPPAECAKPGLTVLFRYAGAPADADAVRYTAPSGARVFAGGAQQLSWPLDTFNLGRFGRTLAPDPRLQQFMRNVFADLTLPAPPADVKLRVRRKTVRVTVRLLPDPRVQQILVFRHRGPLPFQLGDPGVVRVCPSSTGVCMQRRLHRGTYRWAAVTVDQWGQSVPTYSRAVVIRRRGGGQSRP